MAVKKHGVSVRIAGVELSKLLKAIELEHRSAVVLGDTGGPLLDLYETPDAVVVQADVPGMDPADVEVSILGSTVMIEGFKREAVEQDEKVNYLCMERSFENFRRIVKVSTPFNPNAAKAVYQRGVLTITLPRIKDKRGQVVKVKVDRHEP